nr:ribonuclease H-like domain-containing protein [Tanacetum cinerariifolium]
MVITTSGHGVCLTKPIRGDVGDRIDAFASLALMTRGSSPLQCERNGSLLKNAISVLVGNVSDFSSLVAHLESLSRFSVFASPTLIKLCAFINKTTMDAGGRAMRSLKNLLGHNPLMNAPVIILSERNPSRFSTATLPFFIGLLGSMVSSDISGVAPLVKPSRSDCHVPWKVFVPTGASLGSGLLSPSSKVSIGEHTSQPPQPPITSPEDPHMVSSIKLPILKKCEYILYTMKMEQYLAHTDYAIWEVILNGNSTVHMTKDDAGNEIDLPSVTAQQILARTRETKAKSTMLMAIPDEHLARFHGIKYAKTLWAAIKTRFDRVSTEDANQKFLRSLPSAWSNISLIMKNKPGIDNMNIDDLYNNLKVYEYPIADNEDLEQINQDDLEKIDLKWQVVMLSIRVKQFYKKTGRKLEFNGKEQVGFDKTKVECFNCHRSGHFARDCRSVRNSWNRSRDAGNAGYRGRDNDKRPAKEVDEQALVVQDGLGTYD